MISGAAQLPESSSPEGNDAANRIVRRYADRNAVTWNNFDSEATHPTAQLRQHFVPRVALHAV
jgi:hypothetical protein